MAVLATVVEVEDLLLTVIASLVAGVGITFVFSTAIWGGARFADLTREGRPIAAGAAAAIGLLALAGSLALVAAGLVVMTS